MQEAGAVRRFPGLVLGQRQALQRCRGAAGASRRALPLAELPHAAEGLRGLHRRPGRVGRLRSVAFPSAAASGPAPARAPFGRGGRASQRRAAAAGPRLPGRSSGDGAGRGSRGRAWRGEGAELPRLQRSDGTLHLQRVAFFPGRPGSAAPGWGPFGWLRSGRALPVLALPSSWFARRDGRAFRYLLSKPARGALGQQRRDQLYPPRLRHREICNSPVMRSGATATWVPTGS